MRKFVILALLLCSCLSSPQAIDQENPFTPENIRWKLHLMSQPVTIDPETSSLISTGAGIGAAAFTILNQSPTLESWGIGVRLTLSVACFFGAKLLCEFPMMVNNLVVELGNRMG